MTKTMTKAMTKATKVVKKPTKVKNTRKTKHSKKEPKQVGGVNRKRWFKILINDGKNDGRYSGKKPKQAASKALTSILKKNGKSGENTHEKIKFSIIECTRGSKHKVYNYVGQRIKLKNPMPVSIGKGQEEKVINYQYNNRVMKDKTVTK